MRPMKEVRREEQTVKKCTKVCIRLHVHCWTRGEKKGGKHTCKNLHKIFPHDPAELMHDVFQEIHLKLKEKHMSSHAPLWK